MPILILGAAGMLGRKLTAAIMGGALPFSRLTLADVVAPPPVDGAVTLALNLADPGAAAILVKDRPGLIFHLAAVVSGEAEADLARGYAVNLDASRALFDAIAAIPDYCPRVVFASSLAVFGAPFPKVIPDDFHLTPRTSHGTQKAMTALLLSDCSRRGLNGVALRLPTICIRPGAPNRAASGFYSSILREPLSGLPATLPVRDSLRHWFASPRAATGFLLRSDAGNRPAWPQPRAVDARLVGPQRRDDQDAAARGRASGDGPDPPPARPGVVTSWAQACGAKTARSLGFIAESGCDEIIRISVHDENPCHRTA
ncbi:NAD-dependent epimerase/dehydratase family protein [Rhodobacter calidifons]|uniref:NAD-dependent epimerase/dehydratase family protein n=1 Tax=Rhodobacter calidifons TaxID=2715277 RepID=UPI001F601382|nr:NAD-dependent epimerase/dehydratase family protein [Rhodobacter calidifons]